MEAELRDLLPHAVNVRPFLKRDVYGKPQFGTAVEYRARVDYGTRLLRAPDGQQIVSNRQVVVDGLVNDQDEMTLPDGSTPTILAAAPVYDETAFSHTEVSL